MKTRKIVQEEENTRHLSSNQKRIQQSKSEKLTPIFCARSFCTPFQALASRDPLQICIEYPRARHRIQVQKSWLCTDSLVLGEGKGRSPGLLLLAHGRGKYRIFLAARSFVFKTTLQISLSLLSESIVTHGPI
jgi:hypothetical protein